MAERHPGHSTGRGGSMNMQRWLLLIAIAAAGCGGYTAPDEVVFGADVYTQPQPNFDFKPLNNFYLDPVLEVWKDGVQQTSTAIPSAVQSNIQAQMTQYGYPRVGDSTTVLPPSNADTAVRLAWIQNTYAYYYNWCSGYYYG